MYRPNKFIVTSRKMTFEFLGIAFRRHESLPLKPRLTKKLKLSSYFSQVNIFVITKLV